MVDTFQTTVNAYLAPGKIGGWASANPRVSLVPPTTGDLSLANAASWFVGASGALIGRFAFADTASGQVTNASPGTGLTAVESGPNVAAGSVRVGFVPSDQVSLITAYLGGDTLSVLAGAPISLITKGDVWALFAAGATPTQFVFASYADGSCIAQSSLTAPTIAPNVTTTSGSATVTAVSLALAPGQPISGAGIPAGTYVVSYNAVAGTAVLSAAATASATIAATVTTAVYTGFRAESTAAAGEIAKISAWG